LSGQVSRINLSSTKKNIDALSEFIFAKEETLQFEFEDGRWRDASVSGHPNPARAGEG
jgi:hypothetical protein